MKNILRWIVVLPGAVLAMWVVNIANTLTEAFIFPHFVDECCKAWFGSLAFICAAGYIAPKGHFITSVVFASVYCGVGIFAAVICFIEKTPDYSPTYIVVTSILSVLACVFGVLLMREFEKHKHDENLKVAKLN